MQTAAKDQIAKINAVAWSHIHIGSGNKLDRWDYFFHDKKLWLLDEEKLAKIVSKNKLNIPLEIGHRFH
jgi:CRISPR/Cas system CSM-associated protein Csm5 (group 7 of RAMP superfamily)